MIVIVGNFSAKAGQTLLNLGNAVVKNKVSLKTAGLLLENGGKPALSMETQRNIFQKADKEVKIPNCTMRFS